MNGTAEISPGHVGNLLPSQEANLQQLWSIFMLSCDPNVVRPDFAPKELPSPSGSSRKSYRSFFSLSAPQTQLTEAEESAIPAKLLSALQELDASGNEIKNIQSCLSKLNGDELRSAYLSALKQDHPDAVLLRFLRAENWNVPKAYIKLASALHWRAKDFRVDEISVKGEWYAVEQSQKADDPTEKEDSESFLLQLRTGKGRFYGADRLGRPVCIVPVRCHRPGAQTQRGLNNFIIHCIETVRFMQVPPVETMTLIFDLTSFSLTNWDFPPIQFVIKSFQENYPESLGALVFYNAPWIFSGFWKLIRGILDPVVASKVHFLQGPNELEQLIPRDRIPKELGGVDGWEYQYIEPEPQENDRLREASARKEILEERMELGNALFCHTADWLSRSEVDTVRARRNEAIENLRTNYWKLDPYVRCRTLLDRIGVILDGGKIEFYPARGS